MNIARLYHGVAKANGLIYSIGGDPFGSLECYNPLTDTWHMILESDEIQRLKCAQSLVSGMNRYLYVIG